MEGVSAWWSAEPGWWVEFGDTAGHVDSPEGVVEEFVVAAAQGDAVSDAGGAIIGPVHNVMDFAPAGGYRTSRKGASAVADNDRAADRGGHGVAGPPDVEGLTPGTEDDGDDLGVTRDAAGDVGVDRPTQPRVAVPIRPRSIARLTVTTTWGRSPPSVGRSPASNARWARSTRASASRCAAVRRSVSLSVAGRGAASGLSAARTISVASRSSHPTSSQPPSRSRKRRYRRVSGASWGRRPS